MGARYSTRSPQEKDVRAISDFAALIFQDLEGTPPAYTKSQLPPRHFQWKYFQNPIHPSRVRIAEDQNQVIGSQASTFKRLRVGETHFLCAELGDGFTHPQYRRQGVFTKVTTEVCDQLRQDGARVIYTQPNDNSYPGLMKLGFEDVLRPIPVFTILNVASVWKRKAIGRFASRLSLPLAKMVAGIVFRRLRVPVPPQVTVSEISSFDERVDQLWQRVSIDYPVAVVRNREYLNWRYVNKPDEYVIHTVGDGRLLQGYLVTKCQTSPGGLNQGYVVDVLVAKDQPIMLQILLSAAMEHFRSRNVDIVLAWVLKSTRLHQLFRQARFVARGKKLHFLIRTNAMKASDQARLRNPANWLFTMGDTDGI